VWELRKQGARELMSLSAADTRTGALAAFSPDASHVITGDIEIQAAKIWDVGVSGDAEWASFPTDELAPVALDLLPDGDVIAPIALGAAAIWDMESGRRVATLGPARDPGSALVGLAAAPDGTRVAAVPNFSRVVTVWDPSTGDEVFHVTSEDAEITSTAWSPDSEILAFTAGDSLHLYDRDGGEIRRVGAPGRGLLDVAFSPKRDVLLTTAEDQARQGQGMLTWWTFAGARGVTEAREVGLSSIPEALAFDHTGARVAAAQADGSVQVFGVENGQMLTNFSAHSGPVSSIAFSVDGASIATAGEDGTVRLFSAETGTEQLVLRGHSYLVTAVEFTEDGRRLVSASADGIVRVWALDLEELIEIADRNVTRDLTDEECRAYLHLEACSQG
jgi:WD40 repeat protein